MMEVKNVRGRMRWPHPTTPTRGAATCRGVPTSPPPRDAAPVGAASEAVGAWWGKVKCSGTPCGCRGGGAAGSVPDFNLHPCTHPGVLSCSK